MPPDGVTGFTPCLVTTKATSVRIIELVCKVGNFEILFATGEYGAEEFKKYRVVLIDKHFAGIIEDVIYSADASGEFMTIKGKDLKYFLSRRIALPQAASGTSVLAGYDAVNGPTETCIKHYWDVNIQTAVQLSRRVPGFTIAPDLGRGLPDDKYKARHEPLSDITVELAEGSKLIIKATADLTAGTYVFDVAEPTDKTAEQTVLPPVVFTLERQNVLNMEYHDITSSGSNLFYATRSGDQYADEALTLMYYREDEDEPEGIYRHEKHLNVSSDTPTAGQEYEEMRRQVLHEMESYIYNQAFTAAINHTRMRYRVDYNLGDIVTVYNRRWGVMLDTQITGVTTTATENGTAYSVTFGESKPNFIQRIHRDINNR
ncbi:MAG: siphovirus ReqiPepy6 Gp37-like family protein [Eubacteriales bacterium]